jgi:hypothetical protein
MMTFLHGGWEGFATMIVTGLAVGIILIIAFVVALWKLYEKAGQPGWHAIVPVLGQITMAKIAGCEGLQIKTTRIKGI